MEMQASYIFSAFHVVPAGEMYEKEFMSLVASVELLSEHPMAKQIVEIAKKNNFPMVPVIGFNEFPGQGAGGAVEVQPSIYRAVVIGKKDFLKECGLQMPELLEVASRRWKSEGAVLSYAGWDGWIRGVLKFTQKN